MQKYRKQTKKLHRGFTLLEVMLVLIIMVTIASLVVVAVQGQRTAANKRAAFTYIKTLQGLVDRYEFDMGRFPTTEQGLAALLAVPSDVHNPADWAGPYISDTATTRDPWGNEYQYVSPSRDGQRSFEIWSFGPDLIDGTEDDITNWGTLGD
ncbi:MAG: type II secretion system major pseudopilin GspG [Planctomycetaceae bacterium]|nr:type II secretion system major pseudopilin GspG [Planctomycetaceae bacterium]